VMRLFDQRRRVREFVRPRFYFLPGVLDLFSVFLHLLPYLYDPESPEIP
jgi:hypothetical protein